MTQQFALYLIPVAIELLARQMRDRMLVDANSYFLDTLPLDIVLACMRFFRQPLYVSRVLFFHADVFPEDLFRQCPCLIPHHKKQP